VVKVKTMLHEVFKNDLVRGIPPKTLEVVKHPVRGSAPEC